MRILEKFCYNFVERKMKDIKKIAVIGDIHGCIEPLKELYNNIIKHTSDVYSVGDLIDRGKNSKEVIRFCIDNKIKPVMGNHEDMLLKAISSFENKPDDEFGRRLRNCIWNGGEATYISYTGKGRLDFEAFLKMFTECGHLEFISNFQMKIETEYCYISHAGIIEGATDDDLLWNRDVPARLDKFQVCGHTPLKKIEYIPEHYANIDTGCFFTGKLSAAVISKNEVKFLST